MSTEIRRSVGDGMLWPPRAVAEKIDEDDLVIYDDDNHAAHVRSDLSIPVGDCR